MVRAAFVLFADNGVSKPPGICLTHVIGRRVLSTVVPIHSDHDELRTRHCVVKDITHAGPSLLLFFGGGGGGAAIGQVWTHHCAPAKSLNLGCDGIDVLFVFPKEVTRFRQKWGLTRRTLRTSVTRFRENAASRSPQAKKHKTLLFGYTTCCPLSTRRSKCCCGSMQKELHRTRTASNAPGPTDQGLRQETSDAVHSTAPPRHQTEPTDGGCTRKREKDKAPDRSLPQTVKDPLVRGLGNSRTAHTHAGRSHDFIPVKQPRGPGSLVPGLMVCNVVDVCEQEVLHTSKPFKGPHQLVIKTRGVNEEIRAGFTGMRFAMDEV